MNYNMSSVYQRFVNKNMVLIEDEGQELDAN